MQLAHYTLSSFSFLVSCVKMSSYSAPAWLFKSIGKDPGKRLTALFIIFRLKTKKVFKKVVGTATSGCPFCSFTVIYSRNKLLPILH